MGHLFTGTPIRRIDMTIKMAERSGEIAPSYSLGERLASKPSFDQVMATQSFRE